MSDGGMYGELGVSLERELGSDMAKMVEQELREGVHLDLLRAATEQARIAAASERLAVMAPHKPTDALGEHRLRLTPEIWHHWNNKEPGCWRDKKFRDEFWRDNPEVRAPRATRATTIVR